MPIKVLISSGGKEWILIEAREVLEVPERPMLGQGGTQGTDKPPITRKCLLTLLIYFPGKNSLWN